MKIKKTKKTMITDRERIVLSAYFARSNMGMERPTRMEIERLLNEKSNLSLISATYDLCGELMESDEIEKAFLEEAEGWNKAYFAPRKKYNNREAICQTWPHAKQAFWPDDQGNDNE